ncbi:MAG: hypothetical protein PHI64_11055 [Zoogloea sp.]|uniref:hypothetical protein n=1 Tax=Zoogloea sp. TaxID=49181 RepID=UPI0026232F46|nr:hypothetical protein [Zoogloea sp.]MDD2989483.1 hypothetical protein [Zoogloea sp.]
MTPSAPPDLQLRTPAILGSIMLTAAIGLAGGSHHLLQTAEHRARLTAQSLAQTQHRLRQAEQTANQTQEALSRHASLLRTGISSPPDRVVWIEQLESLRKGISIPQLDYEISPERPLQPTASSTDAPPVLLANTLHVHADLPHEDAFLKFINTLHKAHAPIRPSRCQLSRQEEAGRAPGLTVRCDLDWIYLRLPTP